MVQKWKKEMQTASPFPQATSLGVWMMISYQISNTQSQLNDANPLVEQKRSSVMSIKTNSITSSSGKTCIGPVSPDFLDLSFRIPSSQGRDISLADRFLEISLDSEGKEHCPAETIERRSLEEPDLRCDQTIGPLNDANDLLERDTILTLRKSSSEKVGISYFPCKSENDHFKDSPKTRFTPIKRMLDPIRKSRSQRSPPISTEEFGDAKTGGLASTRRNRTLRKSLLHDFSNIGQRKKTDSQFVCEGLNNSGAALSPVHLRGLLKLEYKHGVPLFEFSLKDQEDVLAAKTWKAGSAFNWVYTFHSVNRRKGNRQKESDMVGQMQVSCYLCSEMRNGGTFDNSVVTEFVLYDIEHARLRLASRESIQYSPESVKPSKGTSTESLVIGYDSSNNNSDAPTPYPWATVDLHPSLEIAAIVIKLPIGKEESLKYKREDKGNKVGGKTDPNLFDFSMVEQRTNNPGIVSPGNVMVVTPSGSHGLPSTEEGGGPSPILDRWKSGGGCDCGGWDMACPLIVFGNASCQNVGGRPLMENQKPLELFVQGSKGKVPALTITVLGEGQYSVDFHAQLSKLQAFSICVAALHSGEVSTAVDQERNRQRLEHNSLKLLFEEEVRFLIEAVEEKRKVTKRSEEILPSFIVCPPFSPFSRV